MPRKLVRDSYRGWYGWEARFNSMIRMSLESMSNTNAKNKKERFNYVRKQKQLRENERRFKEKSNKEIYDVKQELFTIRAYGKVYKKHSYANRGIESQSGPSHSSAKREPKTNSSGTRDLSRSAEVNSDDVFRATPRVQRNLTAPILVVHSPQPDETVEQLSESPRLLDNNDKKEHAMSGDNETGQEERKGSCTKRVTFGDEAINAKDTDSDKTPDKQPLILPAVTKECTGSHKADLPTHTEKSSLPSFLNKKKPPVEETFDDLFDDQANGDLIYQPRMVTIPSITSMLFKKKADEDDKEQKQSQQRKTSISKWNKALFLFRDMKAAGVTLDTLSEEQTNSDIDTNSATKMPQAPRELRPKTKQEIRAEIFPAECRNTFTLRRFIEGEADELLSTWTPEVVRRYKVQQILENVRFPELVQRDRTTSAIFRNYKTYREKHPDRCLKRGKLEQVNINETSLNQLREKSKGTKDRYSTAGSSKLTSACPSSNGQQSHPPGVRQHITFR